MAETTADGSDGGLHGHKAMAIVVLGAASIIEFGTTADTCDDSSVCDEKRYAWAIACGVISAIICIVRIILFKVMPVVPSALDIVLSLFLTTLWVFGTAFNTESPDGVFKSTNNGYFSTWIALFAAAYYLALSAATAAAQVASETSRFNPGLAICFIASIIVFSVSAEAKDSNSLCFTSACKDRLSFAIAAGVISFVACLVAIIHIRFGVGPPVLVKLVAFFLVVWWSVGAGVLTSRKGPYPSTDGSANGYFSTWIAFFAALIFGAAEFIQQKSTKEAEIAQG